MTDATHATAVPFTSDDYAATDGAGGGLRSRSAGLDGVLVTPGPDLVWLTGYQPTAITERLTMLFLTPDREPTLLVPTLERPDAEARRGQLPPSRWSDWPDGADPYAAASAIAAPRRDATASPTPPGRCTCSASSSRSRTRATAR